MDDEEVVDVAARTRIGELEIEIAKLKERIEHTVTSLNKIVFDAVKTLPRQRELGQDEEK